MRSVVGNLIKGAALAAVFGITFFSQPAEAVLEGSNREQLEYLDFSETMIRDGLYAKTGKAVFNRSQKKFVRGIKESNAPHIYEPDVYTWELAMAEHRKRLASMAPPPVPPDGLITPVPMTPGGMLPTSPQPLMLTPTGPQSVYETSMPMPADAQARMNNMVYRARARGIHPTRELRAEQLKQKLIDHMNSSSGGAQYGSPSIPALLPALPDLPRGTRGDSYDGEF